MNVLYEKSPQGLNVSEYFANLWVLMVFFCAVGLSLRVHILKEQARIEEKERTVEQVRAEALNELNRDASQNETIGDMKI